MRRAESTSSSRRLWWAVALVGLLLLASLADRAAAGPTAKRPTCFVIVSIYVHLNSDGLLDRLKIGPPKTKGACPKNSRIVLRPTLKPPPRQPNLKLPEVCWRP